MSSVRRRAGAFLLASVVATALILTPRPAQASDLGFICTLLAKSIEYLESRPNPPQGILDKLYAQYNTYCVAS